MLDTIKTLEQRQNRTVEAAKSSKWRGGGQEMTKWGESQTT
jgi:hypothetical protein